MRKAKCKRGHAYFGIYKTDNKGNRYQHCVKCESIRNEYPRINIDEKIKTRADRFKFDDMGLRWRKIWHGHYEISEMGHVRRIGKSRGAGRGRLLKHRLGPDGYPVVSLSIGSVRKHRKIHILLAEAFMGPRPEGKEINHKDGDKTNFSLSNLEYLTHKQNMEHAARMGVMGRKRK